MTAGTAPRLLHAALLHDSAEELAAAAVPFLADGLAVGETAVLACSAEDNLLLAGALGGHGRVLLLPREETYTGSAHAVATYRRLLRRQMAAGVPGIRVVGSIPHDERARQWVEWHRCEAAFNVAMGGMPLSAVCAYDRREISEEMRDGIVETHPALLTPAGLVTNDGYLEPVTVLRRTATAPGDAMPDGSPTLDLADLTDAARLPELRGRVRAAVEGRGRHGHLRGRFAAAVTEVVGNAFRHGTPPVAVRLWTTPTRLAATVTDSGTGFDDPLAGYVPPGNGSVPGGAGLWVARQACDTVEAFRTPAGFTVRLVTTLTRPDAAADPVELTDVDSVTARADRARADAHELTRRLRAPS